MSLDGKHIKITIIVALIITFIIGSYIIVNQEMKNFDKTLSLRVTEQTYHINEKISHIHSFIKIMDNNMQQFLAIQKENNQLHNALNKLKDFPQYKISAIDETLPEEQYKLPGSFSSLQKIADYSIDTKKEISAAFHLSATFLSAFGSLPDLKWVYYLSNNRFIYAMPPFPVSALHIKESNYKKEYWLKAIPDNNPEKSLLMSSIYKDGGGKGLVTTFSQPVYEDGTFRGIIALDVSMDSFNDIMANSDLSGTSFLLDENENILASSTDTEQGSIVPLVDMSSTLSDPNKDDHGYNYIKKELLNGELVFLHRIKRSDQLQTVLQRSIRELILLLSSLIMAYMIYYFRVLIFRVGTLANTDPLTNLLNRRAMENAVVPLINLNRRYEQHMSFLLTDIDYFKKVNDSYGHAMGDEVLIAITKVLDSCLRSSDLLSRHGGEEFLIVLPQTNLESSTLLAERIRTSIENTRTGKHQVAVTTSIGCIEIRKGEGFDAAISRADKMLYQAKMNGRNRVETEL